MNTNLLYVYLLFVSLFATSAFAIPGLTTYQARIIQPNGVPLESNGVSFRFTVLNPAANCILYIEDYNAINMNNTSGLVTFSLGSGTKIYPTSGTVTFQDIFSNSSAPLACQASGTYGPDANDVRKIVMQFNDSNGWQTLPAMSINAVPYAMFATDAQKLGGVSATSYIQYSAIPTCTASQALQYTGSGFLCITAGGGGGASATITAGDITTALGYTPADPATLSTSYTTVAASYSTVTASVSSLGSSVTTVISTVNDLSASLAAIVSSQWLTSGTTISYNSGHVGIGILSPNAKLHIAAGTSSIAPLKLTTGPLLTSPQAGSIEYNGFNLFYTDGASTRHTIATEAEIFTLTAEMASLTALVSGSSGVGFSSLDLGSASATGILAEARLPSFANVTSGSQYTKVTVDGKGRVTSGAPLSALDISTAVGADSLVKIGAFDGYSMNVYAGSGVGNIGTATGTSNEAFGHGGLRFLTSGNRNVAMGIYALGNVTTGSSNIGIGQEAGLVITTGSNNIAIGNNSSVPNGAGNNQLSINNLIYGISNNVGIGTSAPVTKLEVSGGVKISMEAAACVAAYAGTIRYNAGLVEYCNGTSWSTLGVSGSAVSSQWNTSGTTINYLAGNVGIRTASPLQSFSVSGVAVVTGNYGSGENLVVSGEGSRMFFYPKKSAFRAGYVGNDEWDDANIGESSVAIGDSSIATGYGSVALGTGVIASGANSVAMGKYSQALGDRSTAFGEAQAVGDLSTAFDSSYAEGMYSIAMGSSSANADRAIAMGSSANADGESSVAIGQSVHSRAYRSVAVGSYNVGSGSGTAWIATDPIFEVGNSQNGSPRSNAMTILKNGNIGIGNIAPVTKLEVSGGVKISMESAACAVSYAGTLRYNSGNVEYCNGTSWAAFGTGGAVTSASIAAALSYTPANQSTVATSFTTLTNSVNIVGTSITTLTSTVNNLSTSFTNLAAAVSGIATGAKVARVATTANIVLSGLQTIDTIVTLVAGDRVLVKNQSSQGNNGLYIAAAGAWTRAPELDTWQEVLGAEVYVVDGLSNQGMAYMVNTSVLSGTLNTTSIQWTTRGANWFNGNIGFGIDSLTKNISGFDNAAFGNYSLSAATTGSENTGLGNYTFEDLTTGGKNTAVGTSVMAGVTSGSLNTALGYRSLSSLSTGDGNIGIGANAGWLITTGSNNVVIGSNTGAAIATSSNNILLADGQGNERMRITSSGAVGFGTTTPAARLEVSGGIKISGTAATLDIPLTTSTTGYISMNGERVLHASEDYSIFLGRGAGNLAGTGVQDTGIGHQALKSITLGYQNVAVGDFAMADMTIGGENTAIGSEALTNSVSGNANVAVGIQALMNNTSNENTVVGAYALNRAGNGFKNTGTGYAVMNMLTTGSNNVAAGWMALREVTTGNSNVGIGYAAGRFLTTGSGNVIIGGNTGVSFATESNNISINDGVGNERIRVVSSGLVGIGTITPVTKLDVSGAIRISMDSATCATSYAGAIRYNAGNVQFCNGTTWGSFGAEVTSASVVSALGYTPAASGSGASQWTTSSTTISYTGKVGIGLTDPATPLQVAGPSNATPSVANSIFSTKSSISTGIFMGSYNATPFGSWIQSADHVGMFPYPLILNPLGANVGIGLSTPLSRLVVKGLGTTSATSSLNVTDSSNNSHLFVRGDGNVGIGTGSPGARLAVEGTGAVGLQIKTTGAVAADTFNMVNDMDATGNFWFAKGSSNTVPTSPNRLMNITNWGNVEIFGQEVNNTNDNSGILSLKTQASADGGQRNEVSLEFYADRTDLNTPSGYLGYESNTTLDLTLMNSKNGKLILGTSNTAAVTITSASAVGIGTSTPDSALTINSNNTKTTLHLTAMGGGGYLSARGNTSQLDVFGGYEYDLAASNYKARATAAAGVEFNAGTFRVYTNSGLTSGNTFTPTERLRIDTSGNVGIGTTSPINLFHLHATAGNTVLKMSNASTGVTGADGFAIQQTATDVNFINYETGAMGFQTAGQQRMRIASTGEVGIGTSSPGYTLDVSGTLNITTGNWLRFAGVGICSSAGCTATSDRRLKKNIQPLDFSLEKILSLQGVQYDWKDKATYGDKHQVGFVAQDLEKIYPEVIYTDKNTGLKTVAYGNLVAPIVEAVKSLYEKVMVLFDRNEQLSREVAAVKAENAEKTKQLNDIRAYLCSKDPSAPMCK